MTAARRRRVLFLCTGNSARSQMAEALVNHFLADSWEAVSAGTQPAAQVHPLAVRAMAELGLDISARRPKSVEAFRGTSLDLVVTLCGDAAENCPLWLGGGRVGHIGFPDPAAATGTEEEQMAVFRQVRDAIRERVLSFLASPQEEPPAGGFDLHLNL
ncbi:MAG: arsenate reductase ArsC [Anaerolineae bacterium]|nr:arsenate reductase ArsC [Anaerolineae bacterium]